MRDRPMHIQSSIVFKSKTVNSAFHPLIDLRSSGQCRPTRRLLCMWSRVRLLSLDFNVRLECFPLIAQQFLDGWMGGWACENGNEIYHQWVPSMESECCVFPALRFQCRRMDKYKRNANANY